MDCNNNEKTFPLLRLPKEVREMIFIAALQTTAPFQWSDVELLHLERLDHRRHYGRGNPRRHTSHAFRMSSMNFSSFRIVPPQPAAKNLRLTCRQVNAEVRRIYHSTTRPRSIDDNTWHVDIFFNHTDWLRLGPVVYWRSLPCPFSLVKSLAVDVWFDYKECWSKEINGIVPTNYVRGILFELYNILAYHGPSFFTRNASRPKTRFDLVDLHEREGVPEMMSSEWPESTMETMETTTRRPVRAIQHFEIEPAHLLHLDRTSNPVSVTAGISPSIEHSEELITLRNAFTNYPVPGVPTPPEGCSFINVGDLTTHYRGRRVYDLSENRFAQGGLFARHDPYVEDYAYSGLFKNEVQQLRTSSSIYPADGGQYSVKSLQDMGIELARSGYFRWLTRSIGLRFRRTVRAYKSSYGRKRKYDEISTIYE